MMRAFFSALVLVLCAIGAPVLARETYRDCDICPQMVRLPPTEARKYEFAIGKFEVTRGEFAAFIADGGR